MKVCYIGLEHNVGKQPNYKTYISKYISKQEAKQPAALVRLFIISISKFP